MSAAPAALPPILALRNAVLALIRAAPTVTAACGSRVFDVVPTTGPAAVLPNVWCGPAGLARIENGADGLGRLRLRVFVASGEPKRDQAWSLAQGIADAVDGQMPALAGSHHLIDALRVEGMGDVIDRIAPNEVFLDLSTIVQRNP